MVSIRREALRRAIRVLRRHELLVRLLRASRGVSQFRLGLGRLPLQHVQLFVDLASLLVQPPHLLVPPPQLLLGAALLLAVEAQLLLGRLELLPQRGARRERVAVPLVHRPISDAERVVLRGELPQRRLEGDDFLLALANGRVELVAAALHLLALLRGFHDVVRLRVLAAVLVSVHPVPLHLVHQNLELGLQFTDFHGPLAHLQRRAMHVFPKHLVLRAQELGVRLHLVPPLLHRELQLRLAVFQVEHLVGFFVQQIAQLFNLQLQSVVRHHLVLLR